VRESKFTKSEVGSLLRFMLMDKSFLQQVNDQQKKKQGRGLGSLLPTQFLME
jgi:hypothetical protein